ncbi:hypothetical protein OH799_05235 [Nocardia sp. NBC_00881]|nr:hypothetical protein OH799_05235 [Nocardia sp. NBC_00881]
MGGAELASDLSIDELRKQWDNSPETRQDALAEVDACARSVRHRP